MIFIAYRNINHNCWAKLGLLCLPEKRKCESRVLIRRRITSYEPGYEAIWMPIGRPSACCMFSWARQVMLSA